MKVTCWTRLKARWFGIYPKCASCHEAFAKYEQFGQVVCAKCVHWPTMVLTSRGTHCGEHVIVNGLPVVVDWQI